MLQMLQYGCQKKVNQSAPAKFLMYDGNVLKRQGDTFERVSVFFANLKGLSTDISLF